MHAQNLYVTAAMLIFNLVGVARFSRCNKVIHLAQVTEITEVLRGFSNDGVVI